MTPNFNFKTVDTALIPLEEIFVGERFRKAFKDVEKLAESIKENGLATAIAVKMLKEPDNEGHKYKLLAGGRRYKAACIAGLPKIAARLYPHYLTEFEERRIELIENTDRQDLTWQEEVALRAEVHRLYQEQEGVKSTSQSGGHSAAMTADLLKISPATMSLDLELSRYIDVIPELANCETKGDARRLIKNLSQKIIASQVAEGLKTETLSERVIRLIDGYILGDCLEMMSLTLSNSIDLIECDPPYNINIENSRHHKTTGGSQVYQDSFSTHEYLTFLTKLYRECYRILKPGGWIINWFAMDPWHCATAQFLKEAGFKGTTRPIIWVKGNEDGSSITAFCNNMEQRLQAAYEPIFAMHKESAIIQKPGTRDVFFTPQDSQSRRIHPTSKPVALMKKLLETFAPANASILVPFAGSGNTLIAAELLGMSYRGFEISEDFKNLFVQFVSTTAMEEWE